MSFDPDQFIAKVSKAEPTKFNPDEFLAKTTPMAQSEYEKGRSLPESEFGKANRPALEDIRMDTVRKLYGTYDKKKPEFSFDEAQWAEIDDKTKDDWIGAQKDDVFIMPKIGMVRKVGNTRYQLVKKPEEFDARESMKKGLSRLLEAYGESSQGKYKEAAETLDAAAKESELARKEYKQQFGRTVPIISGALPGSRIVTGAIGGAGEVYREVSAGEDISVPRILGATAAGAYVPGAIGAGAKGFTKAVAKDALSIGTATQLGEIGERALQGEDLVRKEDVMNYALPAAVAVPLRGIQKIAGKAAKAEVETKAVADAEPKQIEVTPEAQKTEVPPAVQKILSLKEELQAANEELDATMQAKGKKPVEAVDIGVRDESVSTGSGVETAKETEIIDKMRADAGLPPRTKAQAGITHEALNAQLRSIGAEELDPESFDGFNKGVADAAQKAKQDPAYGQNLLSDLKASERPPSNTEIFSLAVEKQRLTNDLNAVRSEKAKLSEITNETFREQRASELNSREEMLKDNIEETARAIGRNNSKAGAALGAIRVLTNEDFSYAGIVQRVTAATEGKAVSPKGRKVAQELADEIKVNREKAQEVVSRQTKNRLQERVNKGFTTRIYERLEKAGMEAEKRIVERMGRARSGISPEEIADHVTHAAWLMAKGMKSAAELAAHYKQKWGADISKYADEIWGKAKEAVDKSEADDYAQALERRIANIKQQLKDRAPFSPEQKPTPKSPEIAKLQKELDGLEYERQNLRDELQPKPEYVPKEERSLEARKEFRRKRIAELEKSVDAGKAPAPKEKPAKLEDEELADLNARYEMLKDRVEALAEVEAYNAKGIAGKTATQLGALYDTTRNMSATGEFSVVLKQALPATLSSPVRTFKTYVNKMLRGAVAMNHEQLVIENKKMMATPEARQFVANGGFLADIGGHSRNMDEQLIINQFAQNTPGLKQAGAVSQRIGEASAFFLNQVRLDMWKAGMIGADPSAYKNLARTVNDMLGRSSLGKAEAVAPILNRAFFSARFWASTIKNVTGMPLIQGKGVRPYIAKIYLKAFTTALTATAGLYAAMVAKHGEENVEITPFGDVNVKLPSGNKKSYSLVSSLASSAKFGSKIAREGLEAAGIMEEPEKKGPFDKDVWQIGSDYIRTKLHPGAQLATTWVTGKDAVGNQVDRKELWKQAPFYPITYKDIYDAAREDDIPEGVVDFLALMHGAKVNTYEPRKKAEKMPKWK